MNNKELSKKANLIRKDIVKMIGKAGSGHPAGSLGLADIFTVLYFNILKHNPKKPLDKDRDFVFLSNGHVCPVLYSTLAHNDYFSQNELLTLRELGSRLQGHPHVGTLPGVENSGGPLGQGISQAVGLAASLQRDKKKNQVYCFVGDGELEEGQCWEAFMFAAKENLSNLTVIVDRNNIQIDGPTNNFLKIDLLHKKFSAFGFAVIEIDGHSLNQIKLAFEHARKMEKPIAIIAKTIPGKGVSFMENDFNWHGKAPNEEQVKLALKELNSKKILKRETGIDQVRYLEDDVVKIGTYKEIEKKFGFKNIIRIQKKDFNNIDFSKRYLVHFNLQRCQHEIGKVYLLPKIIKRGYYKHERDEVLPILDFENCLVCECVGVKENLCYGDLKKKDFQYSLENIKNVEELKEEILFRYSKSLPNLSKEEILDLGISMTKLKFLTGGNLKNV